MNPVAASLADELTTTLLAARNSDGGWPYYKGKTSRLEPTSAALLALGLGLAPLDTWPRRDGLLVDAGGEINLAFNGFAGIVLAATRPRTATRALTEALVQSRAERLPPSTVNRQDDSIQAWSWTPGTFSWVEPTAWCLLALKRLTSGPRAPQVLRRIAEGERLLWDRMCRDGGWNHGNSNMLGTELAPYVPSTALALLSLHDRGDRGEVKRSLAYLESHQQDERGALALSLAIICLSVYGSVASAALAAMDVEWHRAAFLGNLHVTALTLYALGADHHGCEAFRV